MRRQPMTQETQRAMRPPLHPHQLLLLLPATTTQTADKYPMQKRTRMRRSADFCSLKLVPRRV